MRIDRLKKLVQLTAVVSLAVLQPACGSGNVPRPPEGAADAGPATCPHGCPANYFCAEGTCIPTYGNKTDGGFQFPDAGPHIDAGVQGRDAGNPSAVYCLTCSDDTDCKGNGAHCLCQPGQPCPPGYCATKCSSNSDCPSDATCTAVTEGSNMTIYSVCEPTSGMCP